MDEQQNKKNNETTEERSTLKRRIVQAILQSGETAFIHLNGKLNPAETRLPFRLMFQETATLQIGYNMPVPIPDLFVGVDGFRATLSFKGVPFACSIPWTSVYAVVRENQMGRVWDDEVPQSILNKMEQENKRVEARLEEPKQVQKPTLKPNQGQQKASRPSHLRLVK